MGIRLEPSAWLGMVSHRWKWSGPCPMKQKHWIDNQSYPMPERRKNNEIPRQQNESAEASIPAVFKTAGMDASRIRRTLLAKPEALFRDFADYECRNVAAYLNNPTLDAPQHLLVQKSQRRASEQTTIGHLRVSPNPPKI